MTIADMQLPQQRHGAAKRLDATTQVKIALGRVAFEFEFAMQNSCTTIPIPGQKTGGTRPKLNATNEN